MISEGTMAAPRALADLEAFYISVSEELAFEVVDPAALDLVPGFKYSLQRVAPGEPNPKSAHFYVEQHGAEGPVNRYAAVPIIRGGDAI